MGGGAGRVLIWRCSQAVLSAGECGLALLAVLVWRWPDAGLLLMDFGLLIAERILPEDRSGMSPSAGARTRPGVGVSCLFVIVVPDVSVDYQILQKTLASDELGTHQKAPKMEGHCLAGPSQEPWWVHVSLQGRIG